MFAQGLCVTDGAVLPAITSVPADTRNELIGTFAANAAVLLNGSIRLGSVTGFRSQLRPVLGVAVGGLVDLVALHREAAVFAEVHGWAAADAALQVLRELLQPHEPDSASAQHDPSSTASNNFHFAAGVTPALKRLLCNRLAWVLKIINCER